MNMMIQLNLDQIQPLKIITQIKIPYKIAYSIQMISHTISMLFLL